MIWNDCIPYSNQTVYIYISGLPHQATCCCAFALVLRVGSVQQSPVNRRKCSNIKQALAGQAVGKIRLFQSINLQSLTYLLQTGKNPVYHTAISHQLLSQLSNWTVDIFRLLLK